MEPAASVEDFRSRWLGRYYLGRTFACFSADETFYGTVFWGRPNSEDIELLVRAISIELVPPVIPHGSLIDATRVDGADAGAFKGLAEYVMQNRAALGRQIERLALVRPRGLVGAVVAGFFGVIDAPTHVEAFSDAAEALRWLGRNDTSFLDEIAAICASASQTPPIVSALRNLLASRLTQDFGGPAEAARALGISERTLQRRLKEAGTSFREELSATRVHVAMTLLLDTDAPLTRVALEVGFASLQHFSTTFRNATGVSPRAWRAQAK